MFRMSGQLTSRLAASARVVGSIMLALTMALVTGCATASKRGVVPETRETTANRTFEAGAQGDPVEVLKSLHNKIVYVVEERNHSDGGAVYKLYWIDPDEKQSHLLLVVKDPPTESLTTFYLLGREKMVTHRAVPGNTRTGNDYVSGVDGSSPKYLLRGKVDDVFPDGGRVLFSSDLDEAELVFTLYSADLSGRNIRRLTYRPESVRKVYEHTGDDSGRISPDGSLIIFRSSWSSPDSGGYDDLVRIEGDGSGRTTVRSGQDTHARFETGGFSPDGRLFAAMEHFSLDGRLPNASPGEASFLTIMDIDGNVLQRYENASFLDWSPSNDRLLVTFRPGHIGILDVKTGKTTPLSEVKGSKAFVSSAVWLK